MTLESACPAGQLDPSSRPVIRGSRRDHCGRGRLARKPTLRIAKAERLQDGGPMVVAPDIAQANPRDSLRRELVAISVLGTPRRIENGFPVRAIRGQFQL